MMDMNEQEEPWIHPPMPPLLTKPRPGQLEMIQDGIKALAREGFHLAAAPTGIGKTAASLAAALEVASQSSQKKTVFFLDLKANTTSHRRRHGSTNQQPAQGRMMPVRLVDMVGQAGCASNLCQRIATRFLAAVQPSQKNSLLQTLDHISARPQRAHSRLAAPRR